MKIFGFGYFSRLSLLLAIGLFLLSSNIYAGITIDNFGDDLFVVATGTVPPTAVTSNTVNDNSNGTDDIAPIGITGQRTLLAAKISGTLSRRVSIETIDGALYHSMDSSTTGYTVVQWDSDTDGNNIDPNLNLNLTQDGCDRFRILFISTNEVAKVTFRVFKNNDSSVSSKYELVVPDNTLNTYFLFEYTSFSPESGGGLLSTDWASVGAIEMRIEPNGAQPVDLEIDFLELADPTAVKLESFLATANQSDILIKWKTAMEIDTLGFHLWRSASKNGQYLRITQQLIRAQGGASWGAEYSYSDAINDEKTYYYKLEDIEFNGTSTFHGPVASMPKRYKSTRR